jgi:hypothetical protein
MFFAARILRFTGRRRRSKPLPRSRERTPRPVRHKLQRALHHAGKKFPAGAVETAIDGGKFRISQFFPLARRRLGGWQTFC